MRTLLVVVALSAPLTALAQSAEKQLIVTITSEQLKGGVVSEIAWDGNALVLQGVFAKSSGELDAQYFVQPARDVALEQRTAHTAASAKYWAMKSRRASPTGIGTITVSKDAKMPMYGIASQEQRMYDATQMGGTQVLHATTLGTLLLNERDGPVPPYDGEVWSWSPPHLNRVAYVNKNGDLWIAHADGRDPQRLLRGNFSLPAWSEDGRFIAVAERKDDGRTWEISIVTIPARLLR